MKIGLTGTIGSGKTTVANMLRDIGANVLDADAIARELTSAGSPLCREIADRFGDVLTEDCALDRHALADIVFGDSIALAALNAIMHPAVYRELDRRAEKIFEADSRSAVIFDIPLLMETGHDKLMDAVWLVTADDEARIARVAARDGASREEVLRRIASQMPQEEKIKRATAVIDNSGSLESLRAQVESLYQSRMETDGKEEKEENK